MTRFLDALDERPALWVFLVIEVAIFESSFWLASLATAHLTVEQEVKGECKTRTGRACPLNPEVRAG